LHSILFWERSAPLSVPAPHGQLRSGACVITPANAVDGDQVSGGKPKAKGKAKAKARGNPKAAPKAKTALQEATQVV